MIPSDIPAHDNVSLFLIPPLFLSFRSQVDMYLTLTIAFTQVHSITSNYFLDTS